MAVLSTSSHIGLYQPTKGNPGGKVPKSGAVGSAGYMGNRWDDRMSFGMSNSLVLSLRVISVKPRLA
ncbi:hypothetical protein MCOR02_003031 [Pyricularia oryzae]|nr:hypothetical protein MCOR02_003031 [Pyricularia oryzae]KAI6321015.1 hypothetical protein MCOR34_002767 [Pyricularia oryzae]KAI7919259.1 hypothetical protein M0657_007169 [Pyricularia oryzae]KAI7925452.1 hypothetical protein M9X92_003226 [Pyricularia oryzae]